MALLTPAARLRCMYYLLFTLVGVFHAEVLSRSQPWALVNPAAALIIWPVYGVHYIVLGDMLLRRRITTFFPIFLSGCLLGMYEFAITKVYWQPPWNPTSGAEVGFAWFEVLWVGFAWHAFMSFLIPYVLMQRVFLPDSPRPWASREFRWVAAGVPLFTMGFAAAMGDSPVVLAASIFASLALITLVSFLFTKWAPGWGYTGPQDLVLGRRGRRVAWAGLVITYGLLGLTLRTEAAPQSLAVLAPLPLYGMLFLLLYPHLRRSPAQPATEVAPPRGGPQGAAVEPPVPGPVAALAVAPAAPPVAKAPPLPPTDPWSAARSFLLRYGAMFALFLAATFVLSLVFPAPLIIIVILMVYGSTLGAVVLLAWSVVAGVKAWVAPRKPEAPGSVT